MNNGVQAIFDDQGIDRIAQQPAEAQQRGKAHPEHGCQRKPRQRVAHSGYRLLPDHGEIIPEGCEDVGRRRQDHLGIAEDHDRRLPCQQQGGGEGRRQQQRAQAIVHVRTAGFWPAFL
jgi:hypothetical protein